uniref:Uncharacterized protein n=1 Tax=Avena sativa TaxID=4498 RepID=A0ACD5UHL7_AVESA
MFARKHTYLYINRSYMNPFRTPILLSLLLLVCFTSHAQCLIMEDTENENKVNLPYGLCAHRKTSSGELIYCCLVVYHCYWTADKCKTYCERSARDTTTDTTRALPSFPLI